MCVNPAARELEREAKIDRSFRRVARVGANARARTRLSMKRAFNVVFESVKLDAMKIEAIQRRISAPIFSH